jgi:hypothetical protein
MNRSIWALSGVETDAFAPRDRASVLRRLYTRSAMVVALYCCERRVHDSGCAVCLLGPRLGRSLQVVLGLVVALTLLCGASPWVCVALMAIVVLIGGGQLRLTLRKVTARQHWPSQLTEGRRVYVHCLASVRSGAGAQLLDRLTAEADEKGWCLALHAENERLAAYYRDFGFEAQASGVLRRRSGRAGTGPAQLLRRPALKRGGEM